MARAYVEAWGRRSVSPTDKGPEMIAVILACVATGLVVSVPVIRAYRAIFNR